MSTNNIDNSAVGTNPRTITFWAKPNVAMPNARAILLHLGGAKNLASDDRFGFDLENTPSDANHILYMGGQTTASGKPYSDHDGWHFRAITYVGGVTKARVYYGPNVASVQNGGWTSTPSTTADPLFVGCGLDGALNGLGHLTDWFDGQIQDIRVFGRVLCDDNSPNNGCGGANLEEISGLFFAG